jgi:hypothetical protein
MTKNLNKEILKHKDIVGKMKPPDSSLSPTRFGNGFIIAELIPAAVA